MYDNENKNIKIKKIKKKYVDTSIKEFLEKDIELNINELNEKLLLKQEDKIFLLWKNGNFNIDYISIKELTCKNIKEINKNTIILRTWEDNSEIQMLLRWKNRAGILRPAWQISLKR